MKATKTLKINKKLEASLYKVIRRPFPKNHPHYMALKEIKETLQINPETLRKCIKTIYYDTTLNDLNKPTNIKFYNVLEITQNITKLLLNKHSSKHNEVCNHNEVINNYVYKCKVNNYEVYNYEVYNNNEVYNYEVYNYIYIYNIVTFLNYVHNKYRDNYSGINSVMCRNRESVEIMKEIAFKYFKKLPSSVVVESWASKRKKARPAI